MNTSDAQLSFELQELYLENKEMLSDIHFLEDETRFFQKLFEKVISSPLKEVKFQEIEFINSSLNELQNRRDKLKVLLNSQQRTLELVLADISQKIDLDLITQNTLMSTEIKSLFGADKLIKKELYTLVEQVLTGEKAAHLLKAG